MKTNDLTQPVSSQKLNEDLYKKFGVKVNFNKYTREELENYRNLLRTKLHQTESNSNFNDLLSNEAYQKDKHLVGLLNTRIKEMLGESVLAEKAVSKAQQQAAGVALAAKRAGKKPAGKGAAAQMAKMSTKELEKFAGTKHKGLPKKKTQEVIEEPNEGNEFSGALAKAKAAGAKEFEVDGKTYKVKEAMKVGDTKKSSTGGTITKTKTGIVHKAGNAYSGKTHEKEQEKKVKESAKPDYIDLDKDGNKKETMKKAAADKKKKVKESVEYVFEDEEGKAKSITAGTDMVKDFTSWMTRIGQYQTKSMIELADAIRANFGQAEAEQFKQAVAPALETALNTLTDVREQISQAVAVLAGEAAPVDAMGPDSEMDTMDVDAEEIPPTDDTMNMGDEFGAADAAAGGPEISGRTRRESRELFARKLQEAHAILSKLSK